MIRRAILVAAAAVALTLAPSTAMAEYSAADFGFTVSDSTPTIGVPFIVHVTNAEANQAVTLTMTNKASTTHAGTRSLTKTANAKGVVDFTVTLTQDGAWRIVSTSATGHVLTSQIVTVADKGAVIIAGVGADTGAAAGAAPRGAAGAAPGAVAGAAPHAAPVAAAGGKLAFTGVRGMGLAVGGGVLVLVGAGTVLVTRRRKSAPTRAVIIAGVGAAAGAAAGAAPGAAAGVAPGALAGAAPVAAAGGQLAFTGLQGMGLAVGGGVLALVGAGTVFVTRRRKSARVPA
jgi:hypothetical protein